MTKKKTFLKKFSIEMYKIYLVAGIMLLTILLSGMAGFGFLHYIQGLTQMSSPITLMQSYYFTAFAAFFITLLFNEIYKHATKNLNKGEN